MAKQRNSEAAGATSVTPVAPSFSDTAEVKTIGNLDKLAPAPRPVASIVEEFIRTISTHPDARLLFIDPPSTPEPREALPRLQLVAQKRCQIKFVYKK